MAEATSCGGVVIFRGKILVLYKNYKNRYEGWVLPKGTVEPGGDTQYTFNTVSDTIKKTVHWYLCAADSFYSKPQREEFFEDSGYYKYHEAFHLLRFANERQILEKAYNEYINIRRQGRWE